MYQTPDWPSLNRTLPLTSAPGRATASTTTDTPRLAGSAANPAADCGAFEFAREEPDGVAAARSTPSELFVAPGSVGIFSSFGRAASLGTNFKSSTMK